MSLLDKTNIGIANKPLTVKYAEDLGWKIKKIDGRKTGLDANGKPQNWLCIDMVYKDESICAPLRFWFEPQEKLEHIKFDFWFFGQEELGLYKDGFHAHDRYIETVGDLIECLNLVKLANDCGEKITKFWKEKLSHLKKTSDYD